MNGLEIFFITSALSLFILWIWFIVQGFRASRLWGAGMILLFPVSPFMFAYRFERKSRQTIFYFIGCLLIFISLLGYIQFATIDFYSAFFDKIRHAMPHINFSSEPEVKPVKKKLPTPTYIPPPLDPAAGKPIESSPPAIIQTLPIDKPREKTARRSYQTITVNEAQNHIGKKVVITTETVVHQGKLLSADGGEIRIKKAMGGGSMVMGIKKAKIIKLEVSS